MSGLAVGLAVAGVVLIAASAALIRASGARVRLALRFAAGRSAAVGELPSIAERGTARGRPFRVAGRVRCAEPLATADGERLVAFHRTVEAHLPGAGWRVVDRQRLSRPFDVWDHAARVTIDPHDCAEPLLAIPGIWRGAPSELPDELRPAVARLERESGVTADAARAESRSVSVVDRVLILAVPVVTGDGSIALAPPPGGYVISGVPFDAAMRLLGGTRRLLMAGIAAAALGVAAIGAGSVVALADLIL
ncbi:MAG: hypothetical protein M3295_08025 [Chloroflexota bacterium]|nr:hypothetical protein [Chloroflexota bacterium]